MPGDPSHPYVHVEQGGAVARFLPSICNSSHRRRNSDRVRAAYRGTRARSGHRAECSHPIMWIGHIRHGNWGIVHRCGISVKAQTLVIEREGSGIAETIYLKTVSDLMAEGKHISMNVGDGKKIALIFETKA